MDQHENRILAEDLWNAIARADEPALRTLLSEKCTWRMYGNSSLAGCYVGPDRILQMIARAGELTDDLKSNLIDIFVSEAGAVLRYHVHAVRGYQELDIEHLFMILVQDGQIAEAVFAPIDQSTYDRFFAPQ